MAPNRLVTLNMSRFACIALVLVNFVSVCEASTLIVGSAPIETVSEGIPINSGAYVAQPFSIDLATLTSVTLFFYGNVGPDFDALLQISEVINLGARPQDVRIEAPLAIPSGTSVSSVTVPIEVTLNAGTYFLVLSTSASSSTGAFWARALPLGDSPTFAASYVNSSFAPNSIFGGLFDIDPSAGGPASVGVAFALYGDKAQPIPIPASALLLASGLLGFKTRYTPNLRKVPLELPTKRGHGIVVR